MLRKVLIANRGEIALRIIATARKLAISTVAVYSEADARAMHVRAADEAVAIGPSPATESYLRIDKIIAAAKATGADCIHPGYGFLSENAELPEACVQAGIKFIGPSASAMRQMGGKAEAKAIAESAGVPVVPGWRGEKLEARALLKEAGRIGFPVMIKAVAGGGGRGMRLVEKAEDFIAALESAEREALSAFGDARVLIEKLIVRPRHIEVQVFGDSHGNVVHLFERDCSLQRRNQKVIEEAPAPGMSPELRRKITDAAVKCAKAVGYEGAGTVEFLVEGGILGPKAPWYFIEMNTRLQVEHPVTELVTGLDLVEWQFRVASGERLPLTQEQIRLAGHAVESRLYAEDPAAGFLPSVGRLAAAEMPAGEGIRIDTGVMTGDTVSPFYDPMIAKLITSGSDRTQAFDRMSAALSATVVAGPRTNAAFLKALVDHPDVRAERLDTGLIGRDLEKLVETEPDRGAIAAGVAELIASEALKLTGGDPSPWPWSHNDAFQLGGERRIARKVMVDGHEQGIELTWKAGNLAVAIPAVDGGVAMPVDAPRAAHVRRGGRTAYVLHRLRQTAVSWPVYDIETIEHGGDEDVVRAPINGRVAKVFVTEGQAIAKGERVAVVEAMKMEHVLHAPRAGTIEKVAVKEGAQVNQGALVAALSEG